ncbi:MAG: integrase/recombinase XerD [Gaiellaceae bacterium]|nr:integrase/recombinase XerD [Gaiellaceae bacterium]
MPTVSELIDPFFAWKQGPNRRFAASSRIKYEPHFLDLARWSGARDVAELTSVLVEFEYMPGWAASFEERNNRPPALNTVRLLHNALSSFFDYAWRRGLMRLNPMLAIARPAYEPRFNDWLNTEEDMELATVEMSPLEEIVCGLARLAGVRADEIARLLQGQVDLDGRLLHVYGTKSDASIRSVVIFPELAAKLERWLVFQEARAIVGDRLPLVSTREGQPVEKTYIWRIVKRVAARAGVRLHGRDERGRPVALDASGENVSEVSPHTLRRTFGSDLLNRGARIEVVSRQLGHANTKVTEQAYAKLLTATQRSELLRLGSGYPFFVRDHLAAAAIRVFPLRREHEPPFSVASSGPADASEPATALGSEYRRAKLPPSRG